MIQYGDYNIWKCDLCHASVVVDKKFRPEGWIKPKIILAEITEEEITIPTTICNKCRMSILRTSPSDYLILKKEIFCQKDKNYKLIDVDDKVVAWSDNRINWVYLQANESTCYCSPTCDHYKASLQESAKLIGEGNITKFTCTICEETTISPNEEIPEGWIKLGQKDIEHHSVTLNTEKLICKKCCQILPHHIPEEDLQQMPDEPDE